ncbi:Uncharacterized protein TCM_015393 [Theobroma cacao]|uniref:B3 domain-containing protein n=1 Tax=Theobroma cacao TaxID=3641 RepID=A0A061G904_THECC|nr:Uncharacterized protein TCM_015393 [Theobroma cacao]
MNLLSIDDFKNSKLDPNCSIFDYLLEVTRVAKEKLKKENFNIKQEEVDFKHGKNLDKNSDLGRKLESKLKQEEGLKLRRSKIDKPLWPNPPPDLPENFKEHIVSKMGGSDWLLVIQKPVFFSDVNPGANRLSIPFSQIQRHEFLCKKEVEYLNDKKDMQVRLVEPSLEETTLSFRRWNMKNSSMYVLTKTWNSVVKNNQLKIDDVVQLWSFRVESSLCFALVKVRDVRQGNEEWVRHNETGASLSHQEEGHGGWRRMSCEDGSGASCSRDESHGPLQEAEATNVNGGMLKFISEQSSDHVVEETAKPVLISDAEMLDAEIAEFRPAERRSCSNCC